MPQKGMEDRMHVIGPGDAPILICKKGEVHDLFSQDFFYYYEIWRYFHGGMGFPDGRPWGEQEPIMVENILAMETHYRRHFSMSNVMIQYIEAIIKRMDKGLL